MKDNAIPGNKKARVIRNIGIIRCYLQMDKATFARKSGIGVRASEFEKGRFHPTIEEVEKIAAMVALNPADVINKGLSLKIHVA